MALRLIAGLCLGAFLGILLGYFGKCSTGTCPITRNYFTSVLYGAVIGVVFAGALGPKTAQTPTDERPSAAERAAVEEVSDADFAATVRDSDVPVLVDFWSPWCGPCRAMLPVIDSLAERYAGKIKFAKLNVDDNPATAQAYGVSAVPALLIFRNGQPIERVVGLREADELQSLLDNVLQH